MYTHNTIRYRLEWPRIREALCQGGPLRTLFDGGAGSGEFSRRALHEGLCEEVIALEASNDNFACLEGNLGRSSKAKLLKASLLDIPLPDGCVDGLMCTQVLEHITEHERAAAELSRVLRPGGVGIITVPHPPEPFPNEGHVREGYTEGDLSALFAPHGWEPLRTDYFLTRGTTDRMLRASALPAGGRFLPVAWADGESHLDADQRRASDPFGILMLFRKPTTTCDS
jgi:ubiquinone/menaquinone biosynthesis C-methylase UbiE